MGMVGADRTRERMDGGDGGDVGWSLEGQAEESERYPGGGENRGRIRRRG